MTDILYSVPRGQDGREMLARGTPLFPCAAYQRDIRQYIAGEIPPHWHRELEIFVLDAGSAHVTLSDRAFDLRSGEGYFVNANVLHSVSCRSPAGCRYRSMVFDSSILSGAPGSAFDTLYIRPFTEGGAPACVLREDAAYARAVLEHFSLAFQACQHPADGYEFSVRSALSQIFLLLRENLQETGRRIPTQQDMRMKQMLSWLDEHYSEPVTVSQLAAATGVCVRECQKIFSSLLHLSPMQYLLRRRIAAAAELLEWSDLTVCEAGMRCGFENPSYFSKQFKAVTGVSPKEYRRGRQAPGKASCADAAERHSV